MEKQSNLMDLLKCMDFIPSGSFFIPSVSYFIPLGSFFIPLD